MQEGKLSRHIASGRDSRKVYEDGMARAFAACRTALSENGRLVVVFANKNPDAWEALASSVISFDVARLQTLKISIDKAKAKVPEAIRQAYCIVVTVSDKDDVHAFQIKVVDEAHFETIKRDTRSRVQDTAITAEALLPGGPYSLWKGDEKSRRVKDLVGAFAQLPHLPKMLKSQAIVETLVDACVQGTFVLKLTRPDRTFRTWWRAKPAHSRVFPRDGRAMLVEWQAGVSGRGRIS